MALVLNSGLPAGSKGLWWFAQGLQSLGTAATGIATLSGSALTGGEIVHDNVADRTILAANHSVLLPTTAITVVLGYRKTDATLRVSGAFGIENAIFTTEKCGVNLPFTDGTVYWDFGGSSEGTTRLSAAGLTIGTTDHIWGFTTGARGMEIWQDGVKVDSNAGTPTRTNGTDTFSLGQNSGSGSDLMECQWIFLHETQLTEALIEDISADPEGELTEAGPDVAPSLYYAMQRGA